MFCYHVACLFAFFSLGGMIKVHVRFLVGGLELLCSCYSYNVVHFSALRIN